MPPIKSYKVNWTHSAENDLEEIIKYLIEDNQNIAKQVFSLIQNRAQNLTNLPERGRIVPELKKQGIHRYRELIIKNYRLIYTVFEKNVFVMAVLDSRRDLQDLLLKKFLKEDS